MTAFQALAVSQLSKSFGQRKILNDISLTVSSGEFVVLLGANGAGKTTLFQILSGLFTADAGSATVFGANIATNPIAALSQLGIVFQQAALDLDLSVKANLQFQTDLHGIPRAEAKHRVAHWISRFDLNKHTDDPVRILSGGSRRKVELARALLTKPKILLMDEATVGLDPASRMQILSDIAALCKEEQVGVLWATHLVDEAEIADRIIILASGQIKFNGAASELLNITGSADLTAAFLRLTIEFKQ